MSSSPGGSRATPACIPCRRATASVNCGWQSTPDAVNAAGEWVEKPNFFDVVVYGASGENVAKHIHKGGPVAVDGRFDWRKWETKDGRKAQAVRIIAKTVQFLGGPPSDGGNNGHLDDDAGALHGIATEDEELLDPADQDVIAMAAAEG